VIRNSRLKDSRPSWRVPTTVGTLIRALNSASPEHYLTTHHERDELSNLDYRFARFYDSDIGRFLSVDPLAGSIPLHVVLRIRKWKSD
jgi:RHS repeat-associated protein